MPRRTPAQKKLDAERQSFLDSCLMALYVAEPKLRNILTIACVAHRFVEGKQDLETYIAEKQAAERHASEQEAAK